SLSKRHSRFETQIVSQEMNSAKASGHRIDDSNRTPKIRDLRRHHEISAHHADHRVGITTHLYRLADHFRIAGEMSLPKPVTENHDRLAAVPILFIRDHPPDRGLRTQRLKQVSVAEGRLNLNRFRLAGVIEWLHHHAAEILE